MDPDFIDLQPESDSAELDYLTRPDFLLGDRFIIDESAIGGLQIPDKDTLLVEGDFSVKGRNGRLVDDDVVRWISTHGVQAAPEVEPEWHQEATKMVEVHTPTPETLGDNISLPRGQVTETFRPCEGVCRTPQVLFPLFRRSLWQAAFESL